MMINWPEKYKQELLRAGYSEREADLLVDLSMLCLEKSLQDALEEIKWES